jgi:hypothetical protein
MNLVYKEQARIEDLAPNTCTVHRAGTADGKRWWLLWLYVYRDDRLGELIDLAVPVNPNGTFVENGPGGRTWGLVNIGGGVWQISPSVNVIGQGDARILHPGEHPSAPSIWHQTPTMVGVPGTENWSVQSP